MRHYILLLAAILLGSAWPCPAAGATPSIVTVDIGDRQAQDVWRSSESTTYLVIGNTAIGEIESRSIPRLQKLGLRIDIVESQAAGNDLYLIPRRGLDRAGIGKGPAWEQYGLCLIAFQPGESADGRLLAAGARKITRTQMPAAAWPQTTPPKTTAVPIQWDPYIQGLVDQVDADSIVASIRRMEAFQTRMDLSDSSYACTEWLRQRFQDWGVPVSFDSLYITGSQWGNWPAPGWERNVIATSAGTMVPNKEIIICGHFDSFRYPDTQNVWTYAPGADDNASGVAVAMEAARLFRSHGWEPTVKYAAWAGEEIGLWGSGQYAYNSYQQQRDISAVVNLDMIGYIPDAAYACNSGRINEQAILLSQLVERAAQLYVPGLIINHQIVGAGSDHFPFAYYGYPAVELAERETAYGNPHWHQATDTTGVLDQTYLTLVAKAAIATMAILGTHPDVIDSTRALDLGNGQDVQVSWQASPYSDVVGYWLRWSLMDEANLDSAYIAGRTTTVDTVAGLMIDSTYYFSVTAIDDDGHAGVGAVWVPGTPRLGPLPPTQVLATPAASGLDISWLQNRELDLAGYRLYRAVNDTSVYDSLNTALLTDTAYTDSPLSGAHRYYYKVRAFDFDGNCSPFSGWAYGRPITMDQGLLVVDETKNYSTGSWPKDAAQDSFYNYILEGYPHQQYEFGSPGQRPRLADLVPYSSVLWHGDDYTEFMAAGSVADLRHYLDLGGNLWLAGWEPTANLRASGSYPASFADTSFIKAYLKVAGASLSATTDSFQAATGALGYQSMAVDPTKFPVTTWGGTMRNIEGYVAADSGEVVYTIDMKNNASPFEGDPCGVRHLGPGHRTVLLGFPLYYMNRDQARAAAQQVMADFGETGVEADAEVAIQRPKITLDQNAPNPFSRSTEIRYYLPQASRVSLKVYNVAGQLVRTLVDGISKAGSHQVRWNSMDNNNSRASAGIYLCRLEAPSARITKKIILVR